MAAPPVVLRIKLRYDDAETMVARFAPNVGRSGLFLPTRSMQPEGTEVRFELRLADDTPVLVGLGRVKFARPPDPDQPRAAFGMAIELMRVTRESRELIIRMIERRRALGLPEVGLPMPDDIEAARRAELETAPRGETSGIVRDAMSQLASAPEPELLTAPRPASGPIRAMAAISPLAPEPPRARRPQLADVIARASEHAEGGALALGIDGVDEAKVDVGKVLARARALAAASGSGELDAELAALQESAAAPIEISVEAASAELARQLGGAPVVRKDRSGAVAAWAPPPAVVDAGPAAEAAPEPEPEPAAGAAAAAEAEPAAGAAAAAEAEPAAEAAAAAEAVAVGAPAIIAPAIFAPEIIDPEIIAPEAATTDVEDVARPAALVVDEPEAEAEADVYAEPDDLEDAEELDPDELELEEEYPGEHTQIGAAPLDPETYAGPGTFAGQAELADRLDAQLAEAEAEADAELEGDFADAMQQPTAFGAGYPDPEPAHPEPASGIDAELAVDEEFVAEEVSDLDVLAEADAQDDDLMTAHGEEEAAAAVEPPADDDFASRLALDDEEPAGEPDDLRDRRETYDPYGSPSAVQAASDFDPPSGGYTLAEGYRQEDVEFDEPHMFGGRARSAAVGTDDDLESALEALDVDLDDLAAREAGRPVALPGLPAPRGQPGPQAQATMRGIHASAKLPARPPRRAVTEDDGVLIDFEDDE